MRKQEELLAVIWNSCKREEAFWEVSPLSLIHILDSEDEGELYIGCAGGMDVTATLEYKEVAPEAGDIAVKVTLKGLRGGHSGFSGQYQTVRFFVQNRIYTKVIQLILLYRIPIPVVFLNEMCIRDRCTGIMSVTYSKSGSY